MFTGPRVLIDHASLQHNLTLVRRVAPHSRVWAVIKADAYGHGMEQVAASLEDADGFAVARVEEGLRLRAAGVGKAILVFAGALVPEEVSAAAYHRMELALHQEEQVALLERTLPVRRVRVWVKVDTGMHRLGFDPGAAPGVLQRLSACAGVDARVGLMTHLANADDRISCLLSHS